MWEESRFSAIQIIPRDSKPIASWQSIDEAMKTVAMEIRDIVSEAKPLPFQLPTEIESVSIKLVREQLHSYARLYERIRQRLRPSDLRTKRMEDVFEKMRALAVASYPLLEDLKRSPSPGDRLAAVSILQVFADERSLPFLVDIIGSQKPFVGYHAVKALRIAVGSIDTSSYSQLLAAIQTAQLRLETAAAGFDCDRQTILRLAEQELNAALVAQSEETARYD